MRKILVLSVAMTLSAGLVSSSVLGATEEKSAPKQMIVEALLLCRSQVLMQDGKAIGVRLQACTFLQPKIAQIIHTA